MQTVRRVEGYPWSSLDRVPRRSARLGRAASGAVWDALDPGRLAAALGAVTGAAVTVEVRKVTPGGASSLGADVDVVLGDGGVGIRVSVEPQLASAALSWVLARPVALEAPELLDPVLAGALAAIIVEVARRAGAAPVVLRSAPPSYEAALTVDARVALEDRPYAARATVSVSPGTTASPPVDLASMRDVRVRVPLVGAVSVLDRGEIEQLGVGDAFLPGAGWLVGADGTGRAALAAPGSERGAAVEVASDGTLVVRGDLVRLGVDVSSDDEEETTRGAPALAEAVLETPVVVRVELGAVSMTVAEWGSLHAGDVIETGRRIAEPVVLRVAGRAVAEGELVNVEGELGVRVTKIHEAKAEP